MSIPYAQCVLPLDLFSKLWFISFAQTHMRRHKLSAHIALEEQYAELSRYPAGSLGKFASTAYVGINQNQLERLIAAVEK